jgi:diacylglycerol kinase family enzyme
MADAAAATTPAAAARRAPDSPGPAAGAARRIEVILNDTAGTGGGEEAREKLSEVFAGGGADARVHLARGGEELIELAGRAAGDALCGAVVAGGGDGTINAVGSQLVGTDKPFGVLPLGTLNHFAKDLGIPLALEEAARVLLAGRTTLVDVGEVNGRFFLNNSSLGLYPDIVRERERHQERRGWGKWAAMGRATVTVLRRYPYLKARLEVDGRELMRRTPIIFVGNNEYKLDAFEIGSRARLDAGALCLHLTRATTRLGLFRLALGALTGGLHEAEDFESMGAREINIRTRRSRARVALDGEVTVMSMPLRYRIRPGALRVFVPEKIISDE